MVPETLEGWAVLHEVYRIDWPSWNRLPEKERSRATSEAVDYLSRISTPPEGESAAFSLLGHKGDLLLLHFRPTLDDLNQVELGFRKLRLSALLAEVDSYLSYVELGMYELTAKLHGQFLAEGLEPDSEAWREKWQAEMAAQKERVQSRLYQPIPRDRYLCFYPMNKRRGETVNWYWEPMARRQHMMRDHGLIGRKYSGRVTQVITGSIGFDDWEWGVYLFAEDPLVFKKLVYEMRFDEASALYGEFGPFCVGLRFSPEELPRLFCGQTPRLHGGE
ncbi:MAG: heme-dependent peroxidase [Candidatus Tectomicrobia bacterium]|nr:heme-dependent peroxidase [Candidatus Tectomicrobia bacterium]